MKTNSPGEVELIRRCIKELEAHKEYMSSILENKNPERVIKLSIRAGDKGTLEALKSQIEKVFSQYEDQKYVIMSEGVGVFTENDIEEAALYGCYAYGMDVSTSADLERLSIKVNVPYKIHKILYALTDDLSTDIENFRNEGKVKEEQKGLGVVNEIFNVTIQKKSYFFVC